MDGSHRGAAGGRWFPSESMNPRPCAIALLVFGLLGTRSAPLRAQAETQDPRAAQPERPTVATHAYTVAPKYIELEIGGQRYESGSATTRRDRPMLLKIGVSGRLQIDLFAGVTRLTGSSATLAIGDISAGMKWRVLDAAPVLGAFAVQATIKVPSGSVEASSGTGTTDTNLILISSRQFSGVSLDLNLGFTARTGDGSVAPTRATMWTVSSGLPVHGRLRWSAEIFGYPGTRGASGEPPIVGVLTGPTCIVRKYLVLDAGGIVGLAGDQPTVFYAGLTWNIGGLSRGQAHRPQISSIRTPSH